MAWSQAGPLRRAWNRTHASDLGQRITLNIGNSDTRGQRGQRITSDSGDSEYSHPRDLDPVAPPALLPNDALQRTHPNDRSMFREHR